MSEVFGGKARSKNEPFIESRGRRSDVDLVDLETQ